MGREDEVREIVKFLRAAEVGRLLLSEINGMMEPIYPEHFIDLPRKEIQARKFRIRDYLRGEVRKFCTRNFETAKELDLAKLYDPLMEHRCSWRLPLTDFVELVGPVKKGILRGAPLHATVVLSQWGLQTEYPEMHIMKDLAIAWNNALDVQQRLKKEGYSTLPYSMLKDQDIRPEFAELIRYEAMYRRTAIQGCFNLLEAYINGLAWEYVHRNGMEQLSNKKKKMFEEAFDSLTNRLVQIPPIVAGRPDDVLFDTNKSPLREFVEGIKPYRDSMVHPSPFSAPEKFGGYDKLERIYNLDIEVVERAIEITKELIRGVHEFIHGEDSLPRWFLPQSAEDKRFDLSNA